MMPSLNFFSAQLPQTYSTSSKRPAERDAQEKPRKLLQDIYKQIINGHFILALSYLYFWTDEYSPASSV